LPRAALRELGGAIRHLAPARAGQAFAIAIGLLTTTAGYVVGAASLRLGRA
jgi:hypothetical protein